MNSDFSVLYFSGTGNSRYVARKISTSLDCDVIDLGKLIKNSSSEPLNLNKNCVIVVPLYFWRIPSIVESYLLNNKLNGASNIWYVMTYGGEFANCDKYNSILSRKLHLNHMGTAGVIMPCNHVTMMDVPDQQKTASKLSDAEKSIFSIIESLSSESAFPPCNPSFIDKAKSLVCPLVCKVMITEKPFWVSDKCTGCGKCAELCQLNNINLIDRKPNWGNNCIHCLSCINMCPSKAIEYGKDTVNRGRYFLD